jgi:hypothetical protein
LLLSLLCVSNTCLFTLLLFCVSTISSTLLLCLLLCCYCCALPLWFSNLYCLLLFTLCKLQLGVFFKTITNFFLWGNFFPHFFCVFLILSLFVVFSYFYIWFVVKFYLFSWLIFLCFLVQVFYKSFCALK